MEEVREDQVTESVKLQRAFGFDAGKARNYPECVARVHREVLVSH